MRRLVFVVPALLVLAACGSASDAASTTTSTSSPGCRTEGVTATRDVRYASTPGTDASFQSLDLYRPRRPAGCGLTPLVVWVHGGAFVVGDKANQIADKVRLFTDAGWALASVNYRLVGRPGVGPDNGRAPAAEDDLTAALDYLSRHAAAENIDPHRIALMGHSSGAFLVSLHSTQDGRDVRCTVALDTTYDITAQITSQSSERAMYLNAFGDDPTVWARESPMANVAAAKAIPPFHIVTRGQPTRVAQAQQFGAELRANGGSADVQVASGLTHAGVNAAVGAPGDTVITPPLAAFLHDCFA